MDPGQSRGTLESRYDARVRELLESDPQAAIDYMLRAVPLIDEYARDSDIQTKTAHRSHLDTFGFTVTATSSKSELFCRYMAEVEHDPSYLNESQPKKKAAMRGHDESDWICTACNTNTIFDQAQSMMVCPNCGESRAYMEMNHHNLSFNEQVSMEVSSHCAYKRVNHFRHVFVPENPFFACSISSPTASSCRSEWINSLQARESTVIPEEILEAVRAEFKKARATTRADITPTTIKQHLKKLRLSKWYEHTHAICNALNGTPAPKLSPALETRLKTMFNEIQAPFDKWVKIVAPQRKNFLSYGYVLYKFCELLGEDSLLQYFSLLKSQDKLYQMDAIWKRMCAELEWEFIASI